MILLVSQAPERRLEWIAALYVTMVVCAVVLVLSERIQRFAGKCLMMAVAVEKLLRGIRMFLTQMPRQDVRNLIFESICRQRARGFFAAGSQTGWLWNPPVRLVQAPVFKTEPAKAFASCVQADRFLGQHALFSACSSYNELHPPLLRFFHGCS